MAVTTTTRFGLTRWSAGADPFGRAQMDSSHAQIESLAAGFLSGTEAGRPVASAANSGFYYHATDTGRLFFSAGNTWKQIPKDPGAVTAETAFGMASTNGVADGWARADHGHGTPAHGAAQHSVGTAVPTGAVRDETTFGMAKQDGVGTGAARHDHGHGSPAHGLGQHGATVVDHGSIAGLADDDHGQYLNAARHTATAHDHGALTGTADDDHAQYLNTARHDLVARHGATVVDHGSIGGLGDDDHPHYYNAARHTKAVHDALGLAHSSLSGLTAGDPHTQYKLKTEALTDQIQIDTWASDSNVNAMDQVDVFEGLGTYTLPAGWGSMDVVVDGWILWQISACGAAPVARWGSGTPGIPIDVDDNPLLVDWEYDLKIGGTVIEMFEMQMLQRRSVQQFYMPLTSVRHAVAADGTVQLNRTGHTNGAELTAADRWLRIMKIRRS